MKNFKSIFVMVTISMGLMSCSSEEIFTPEDTTNKLLENYTVKRNADGSYYVDYNLAENAEASLSASKNSNSKDFYLYSSDNQSKKSFKEALSIQNSSLRVGFNDSENGKKSFITVIDDDIKFNRDADEDFLTEYSVTDNGDNTITINFKVAEGVEVEHVYNEDEDIYEFHLEDGNNSQRDFTKTFVKEDGIPLNIDFVNYHPNTTARDDEMVSVSTKPRVVVGGGSNGSGGGNS